ncbi:MAG: hypothetical protein ACR2KQ_09980 [Actinomycetota bacterium]
MKLTVPLLLVLLVTGCAADSEVASREPPLAQLVVERVQPDGPIAIEGSVSFARIEGWDGLVVAEEGFDAPDHGTDLGTSGYPSQLELELEPGPYTLVSYQRACDGTCDSLDPANDDYTCQHPIEVEKGKTLSAQVRLFDSDCEIEVAVISP